MAACVVLCVFLVMIALVVVDVCGTCQPSYPLILSHSSATGTYGTVASKSQYSSYYPAWKAFQYNNELWISGVRDSPTWISYTFKRTVTIRGYRLFFKNGSLTSRAPKTFDLQVKRGSTWVTVDSRCCETNWTGAEERSYSMNSDASGQEFRFLFYDDNDARSGVVVISLAGIQLLGV